MSSYAIVRNVMEGLQERELVAAEGAEESRELEAALLEPPPRFVDYGLDI